MSAKANSDAQKRGREPSRGGGKSVSKRGSRAPETGAASTASLSPKDLALALGVSESSVKRWVDVGRIEATKTAGGHRRIALSEAIRYVRDTGAEVIRPEILGLKTVDGRRGTPRPETVETQLHDDLLAGNEFEARSLIVSLFLDGQSVAEIVDGPLGHALARIGAIYESNFESGVFLEHRASEIAASALREIGTLVRASREGPAAIGAAVTGDSHNLPTLVVSLVLRSEGLNATSLGSNLPFPSLALAIDRYSPKVVWLSVSHIENQEAIEEGIASTLEILKKRDAFLLLGGCAASRLNLPSSRSVY
ncbi:MAG: helix-turn-helix domain-containing protein, partial [Planctomycetota bacterium]